MADPSAINYSRFVSNRPSDPEWRMEAYLVDILARELSDELLKTVVVDLNTSGAENGLDVLRGGRGVTAEGEEEVGCEVLHCTVGILFSDKQRDYWSEG